MVSSSDALSPPGYSEKGPILAGTERAGSAGSRGGFSAHPACPRARTPPAGRDVPCLQHPRANRLISRGSGSPNERPVFRITTDPDTLPYFVTIPGKEHPPSKRVLRGSFGPFASCSADFPNRVGRCSEPRGSLIPGAPRTLGCKALPCNYLRPRCVGGSALPRYQCARIARISTHASSRANVSTFSSCL